METCVMKSSAQSVGVGVVFPSTLCILSYSFLASWLSFIFTGWKMKARLKKQVSLLFACYSVISHNTISTNNTDGINKVDILSINFYLSRLRKTKCLYMFVYNLINLSCTPIRRKEEKSINPHEQLSEPFLQKPKANYTFF